MEKISALIDKLQELKNTNAGLQAISYYVQLLQAEILHARSLQKEREQPQQVSNIAVIMPAATLDTTAPATPEVQPLATASAGAASAPGQEEKPASPIYVSKQEQPQTAAPAANNNHHAPVSKQENRPATTTENTPATPGHGKEPLVLPYHSTNLPKPVPAPQPEPSQPEPPQPVEKKPAFITIYGQSQHPAPAPAPKPEPVMASIGGKQDNNGVRKELKELNQLVAQSIPSLNDRLRQGRSELADRYSEMPVKDLRSAIGINDKFQFVQELFRGDVDTYERSLKTINDFHSLQEAEYWIERELKIRQGWVDDNHAVQQFYSLVRKRFS